MNYLKQYEYIAAIAEFKSITIAAEKLGIAQSALSRYVKKMEADIGVQLLYRNSNQVGLTQTGYCFLEIGRKMLSLDKGLRLHIRDIQMSDRVTIRVGISPSRAPYILPGIIDLFRKQDDKTNLEIFELTTDEIKERLLKNEIDIAISVYDVDSPRIEYVKLFNERILLCDNPKASCNHPILPGKGQLLREIMNMIVTNNKHYSMSYIEVQNTETAVAMVKAGLGFTVVPSYYEEFSHGDGLRYSELSNKISLNERIVSLLYLKDRILKNEEEFFLKCAEKSLSMY